MQGVVSDRISGYGPSLLKWTTLGAAAWCLGRMALRRYRHYDFAGRTVLITGGSRGLGLVLARKLVDQGARVAICACDRAEVDRAQSELTLSGGNALGLVCDVTDPASVQQAVSTLRETWGPVDVLINNAGVIQVGPHEEMLVEDYEHAMEIHYWGPLFTMLSVLPEMRQRGSGRIVNISSIGGIISVPHLLPYSASKFALVGLSEGFRAELLKEGIYVTTICPGLMRTGSAGNALFKGQNEAEAAWFSISASAPLASMSADRAADQILQACQEGRATRVLSLPAKFAALVHGIAPGLVTDIFGLTNWLLPGPGGIGTKQANGYESRPDWIPGWVTQLGDRAARRNNELTPVTQDGTD